MSEYRLEAAPLLGGYAEDFEGAALEEVTGLAIVSIAVPRGGEAAFGKALKKAYGIEVPEPGSSRHASDGATRLVWTAPDQLFALFDHGGCDAAEIVAARLDGAGYVTLQSDNWVILRLSGERAREALERICPLDLHPERFTEGAAQRTVMEHLGAFVLREGDGRFLLLSPSSSARSFLHAVETSVRNLA